MARAGARSGPFFIWSLFIAYWAVSVKKNPQSRLRVSSGFLASDLTCTRSYFQKKSQKSSQQKQVASQAHSAQGFLSGGAGNRFRSCWAARKHGPDKNIGYSSCQSIFCRSQLRNNQPLRCFSEPSRELS
jgi:hypothetical protein